MDVSEVLADLIAEQDSLDKIVAGLSADQWDTPTVSPRWRVREQIAHLAYFDHTAALAITDPDGFKAMAAELMETAGGDGEAMDAATVGLYGGLDPTTMLSRWRADRSRLADAAGTLENDTRVLWYGPSMGSKSFLTARLMEAWAHGQDVADALGMSRESSDRIRHIAQLGFITRGWTYKNRRLDEPSAAIHVHLESPSGDVWTYGPEDAPQSVTGLAEDFCLVVTQRRHVDDTELLVNGTDARDWLLKAQCFAGPPTDGPTPTSS